MTDKNGKSLDELKSVTKCKVKIGGRTVTGQIQALHTATEQVTVTVGGKKGPDQHTVLARDIELI